MLHLLKYNKDMKKKYALAGILALAVSLLLLFSGPVAGATVNPPASIGYGYGYSSP